MLVLGFSCGRNNQKTRSWDRDRDHASWGRLKLEERKYGRKHSTCIVQCKPQSQNYCTPHLRNVCEVQRFFIEIETQTHTLRILTTGTEVKSISIIVGAVRGLLLVVSGSRA